MPESRRAAILASLTAEERSRLLYLWRVWARPKQLTPPGDWLVWLILAGRGFGKSRTGAEWVRENVTAGKAARIALVADTAADAREVMVEGESGILATSPPWFRPTYEPSKRRLTWPNGAIATTYSAEEPDQLRGPQHDLAWADELAKWRYPDAWDQLRFGLRLGRDPRVIVTTTPRPTPIIRSLISEATTHVTRGATHENRANLAPAFLATVVARYEGTRLGRQELYAEILDDVPGALWKRDTIDSARVREAPALRRIVVAIDPAVTSGEASDETGIVVVGVSHDGHGYVLDDASGRHTPNEWARIAVAKLDAWRADRIVAEVNNGGDLVETNIRTVRRNAPFTAVRASRGKATRAEPVAALYEQGKVHHVGMLATLEDQLCSWEPSAAKSPDRLDALVWGLSNLMLGEAEPARGVGQAPIGLF